MHLINSAETTRSTFCNPPSYTKLKRSPNQYKRTRNIENTIHVYCPIYFGEYFRNQRWVMATRMRKTYSKRCPRQHSSRLLKSVGVPLFQIIALFLFFRFLSCLLIFILNDFIVEFFYTTWTQVYIRPSSQSEKSPSFLFL